MFCATQCVRSCIPHTTSNGHAMQVLRAACNNIVLTLLPLTKFLHFPCAARACCSGQLSWIERNKHCLWQTSCCLVDAPNCDGQATARGRFGMRHHDSSHEMIWGSIILVREL